MSDRASVDAMVVQVESELGPIDLLVANAGIGGPDGPTWEVDPGRVVARARGERARRLPLLPRRDPGHARARRRPHRDHRQRRGLPSRRDAAPAYPTSKAAVCRYGETLANELAGRIPVFFISPGLVQTEMTGGSFPDDAPWTPPELAPQLVRVLASGRADALAGRYLHAEHDDIEDLIRRADEIRARRPNAIRLQR